MIKIFGYGSLIWKHDFPFVSKKVGRLAGFVRRFWQSSSDHRGTAENPGRVVTLISIAEWIDHFASLDPNPKHDDFVYGAVFEIDEAKKDEVFQYLDYREKNGYKLLEVAVEVEIDGMFQKETCFVYIAPMNDVDFLGPSKDGLESIANQIIHSTGPSGPNYEYLFGLVEALGNRADSHLLDLYKLVSNRLNQNLTHNHLQDYLDLH
jgi:cation transport protein ChaC